MLIDKNNLDKLLRKTVETVEKSQEEIYRINENARQEYERIKRELIYVKKETSLVIQKVDQLEKEYYHARIKLMEINRNFQKYSEDEIKDAYEAAQKKQIELIGLREKEKLLRMQRDYYERNLENLKETMHRSENLISNMNIALCFLTNDLGELSTQIGEIQQMQNLGLSIIRAQEEERKRVAREIHDGPAQNLANIVMQTEFCIKLLEKRPELIKEELIRLVDLVRNSLQDMRKIIFNLRPMVLDDLGLIPAIKKYTEQYQKEYNIYVNITIFGQERRLDSSLEVALFRIIQESLTNIKKHAEAKQAVIKIEFLENKIIVSVKDDGKGFDLKSHVEKQNSGFGLLGMKERLQLLKGTLKIKTAPGKGTEIILSVPSPSLN